MAAAAILAEYVDMFVENYDAIRLRRRRQMYRTRELRDTSDPFMIGEEKFRRFYRMTLAVAIHLIELLRPFLKASVHGIRPYLQVLSTLRLLAEGSYQKGAGNDHNHPMSQPSISRYLHDVVRAIKQLADQYIVFPNTMEDRQRIAQRFTEKFDFPMQILGALDCTLPKIHTPSDHEEAYLNHKQTHSLNVQVVSDADCNILNVRITNGSTNDKFVWRWSTCRTNLLNLRNNDRIRMAEGKYFVIADNGYNPSKVVLTPVRGALPNTPEYNYTMRLCNARCVIEKLFGIWKQVMRCLNSDRALHYKPQFGAQIVVACAVLYNFLRRQGMPMPVPAGENQQPDPHIEHEHDEEYAEGLRAREEIINRYFRNH